MLTRAIEVISLMKGPGVSFRCLELQGRGFPVEEIIDWLTWPLGVKGLSQCDSLLLSGGAGGVSGRARECATGVPRP